MAGDDSPVVISGLWGGDGDAASHRDRCRRRHSGRGNTGLDRDAPCHAFSKRNGYLDTLTPTLSHAEQNGCAANSHQATRRRHTA